MTTASPSSPVRVTWRSHELESTEHFELSHTDCGWVLSGSVTIPIDGTPGQIRYLVDTNERWETTSVEITINASDHTRVISLARSAQRWTIDDVERPDLDGCMDVDLGWTPATNTLAIRRLDLTIGDRGDTTAAWVRFPQLTIEPLTQLPPKPKERLCVSVDEFRG